MNLKQSMQDIGQAKYKTYHIIVRGEREMEKIILYFNFEDKVFEYHLPAIDNRKLVIDLIHRCTTQKCKVNFEVWDGQWKIETNKYVNLMVDGEYIDECALDPSNVIQGVVSSTNEVFTILVARQSNNLANFKKYYIKGQEEYAVGSGADCDIQVFDEFVSNRHTVIYAKCGNWYVKDVSSNGTFLNNRRILGDIKLNVFDNIFISGIRIIFLGNILAINNDEKIKVSIPEIDISELQIGLQEDEEEYESKENEDYFSRSPRSMEPLISDNVEIEAPPTAQRQKKQPLIFIIGPSVTMPIPIMLSVLFNMNMNTNTSNPMMYVGTLVSVLTSALIGASWAIAHNKYNKKEEKQDEEARVEGYSKYIDKNKELLEDRHKENKKLLSKQYITTVDLVDVVEKNRNELWNRNINHSDFLTIRLGTGKVKFPANIQIPKERFSLNEDELVEKPFELYEEYKNMEEAPSLLSLRDKKLIGVIGEHKRVLDIARSMIIQIAALHCYTDVKIAFLSGQEDEEKVKWVKWLPHVFSSDKKIRFIANDANSYQNILYALTSELRTRDEEDDKSRRKIPHYIVFCTEAELIEKETIYSYITSTKDYGFTFILLYDQMNRLPNECKQIIENRFDFTGAYALDEMKNETNRINFDIVSGSDASKFVRSISGIYVNEASGGEIPSAIDFLEMLQIPNLEQWDLVKHYKENRAYEGLKSFIGITNGNKPMYLDIHEKKYGPHGLIAGTTGSGKSETIMTFILSLVMNYHPDEVAFVLIDYKGGGMAAPFIGLPHIAGTITNIGNDDEAESIDENQTRRALISIKSEIKRRQKIFSKYKINHIDAYIRLYRDGQADGPLPHLIMISDEFAELKKEQPEFIKELVSAARVGRSLGIHLILATQKPAGVVDDEIWSNSRFKICLRVQDKQDSLGMLKRPEAAYITGTGRAYLQIGNDEIFEMFQSGYAGGEYEPTDKIELSQHSEVKMIEIDGSQSVIRVRKQKKGTESISQLDACINYVKEMSRKEGIEWTRPLWLPQLPKNITIKDIEDKYQVNIDDGIIAVFGLIDEPEMQKQSPAFIDFLETANVMIEGSIGMGKTTLLQTILYSLVSKYDSSEVNMYCLDFSSRTMKMFERLPHCGGVAFSEDEESVTRMFKLIMELMEQRKTLFEKLGVGSFVEARKTETLPMVLLVIDNFVLLKELYTDLEDVFGMILREGVKFGIQILVTVNSDSDMNYRFRQNISKIIPLYLGEKGKYVDALGQMPEILPYNVKGRGLIKYEGINEYQTALPVAGVDEVARNKELICAFEKIAAEDNGTSTTRIRTIPKDEVYSQFITRCNDNIKDIPLGYNIDNIANEYIDLHKIYCYTVSVSMVKNATFLINNIVFASQVLNNTLYRIGSVSSGESNVINIDTNEMFEFAKVLRQEFIDRNSYKKSLNVASTDIRESVRNEFKDLIVIIDNLNEFCSKIYSKDYDEEIYPIMELFIKQGSGLGIYFVGVLEQGDYYQVAATNFGKQFLSSREGLHLGGHLDQQKVFDFPYTLSQQMKGQDINIANQIVDGVCSEIYIPLDVESR